MKKLITTLLLIASVGSYAQIITEHQYPNGNWFTEGYMKVIRLSTSGDKYVTYDTSAITLYNLNHSLFRTINIPPSAYSGAGSFFVWYISEELFNTNPADIEYFVWAGSVCKIYDETGTLLFSKDSVMILPTSNETALYGGFISYTSNGYKMILSTPGFTGQHTIYALPGFLPCHDCVNGVINGMPTINQTSKNESLTNYPNPATTQTTITYTLPQGTTADDLVFYNLAGAEIKRFKVTNAFNDIVISTTDLAQGTYYYELQTIRGFKEGKKMVVIK